jgi:glycosyltransferase involved in cell wall biosynthesis
MNDNPLVSIVIPTFNRPVQVMRAIQSVRDQTYRNLEIIVQDNASEVDISARIDALGDRRVRYYRNTQNIGQTRNFGAGLRNTAGTFVGLLADDDFVTSEWVQSLVKPLIDNPEVVASFCDYWATDESNAINHALTQKLSRYFGMEVIKPGFHPECETLALRYRSLPIFSACLLRASAANWADIVAADTGADLYSDLYLMYQLARTQKGCYYTARKLSHKAFWSGTLTAQSTLTAQAARAGLFYWTLIRKDPLLQYRGFYELKCAHSVALLVYCLLKQHQWSEAVAELWKGVRSGMILPTTLVEHLVALHQFRRAGLQRRFMP